MATTDLTLAPVWRTNPGRWDFAMAAHLLGRAGFGGTLPEIQTLYALGPQKAVDSLINPPAEPKGYFPELTFGEFSGMRTGMRQRNNVMRQLNDDERQALRGVINQAERGKLEELKIWWLDRMVRTNRPLEEKMTLLFHGLYVSSAATVRSPVLLHKQNQLFRKFAINGNFKKLTHEVSRDPAMILYLNNNENKKAHPNENYARELMELFTMGRGNYTEADIKESARAFTGFAVNGEDFVFRKGDHDEGEKTFLNRRGNFDGDDIVDLIFQQPATQKYLATRLLKFFGVDDPPIAIITQLAGVLKSNQFNIGPTLAVLFGSKWFYSDDVMQNQIKSPVQLVVGSLRTLGTPVADPRAVDNALKLMGQEIFNSPTVKGWDGGRAWINTSTLFARYNLPAYLVTGKLPSVSGRVPNNADQRKEYADIQTAWSPMIDLAQNNIHTTDGVVDLYLKMLVPAGIDERKRDELVSFLNGGGDPNAHVFDPIAPESESRLRALVHLIMTLPEYQIC